MYRKLLIIPFLFIIQLGYAQHKQAPDPITLADSLVKLVIKQEGLFTLYGGLKPISTVQHFSFDTDSITGDYLDQDAVENNLTILSNSLKLLSNDSIGYTVLPFKAVNGSKKSFEILIFHKPSLKKLLSKKSDFFLRRGIIPGDNIEKILAIYEFEDKYDRYKAYGYLFGYPDHAVDFFVKAAKINDDEGNFVERDFYQIPVASGQEGRFVYAVPKDYEARDVDENLKSHAGSILSQYQRDWETYLDRAHQDDSRVNLNFLFFLSGKNRTKNSSHITHNN